MKSPREIIPGPEIFLLSFSSILPDFDSKTPFLGGSGPGNPMFSRAWFGKSSKT
jgi:hypothetical protein